MKIFHMNLKTRGGPLLCAKLLEHPAKAFFSDEEKPTQRAWALPCGPDALGLLPGYRLCRGGVRMTPRLFPITNNLASMHSNKKLRMKSFMIIVEILKLPKNLIFTSLRFFGIFSIWKFFLKILVTKKLIFSNI